MNTTNSISAFVIILLALVVVFIFIAVPFVIRIYNYRRESQYIRMEIARSRGAERKKWKRELKTLRKRFFLGEK